MITNELAPSLTGAKRVNPFKNFSLEDRGSVLKPNSHPSHPPSLSKFFPFFTLPLEVKGKPVNSKTVTTMDDVELNFQSHGGGHGYSKQPCTDKRTRDDDAYLQSLGKRPLLNRAFGFMSILGLSCSALLSWEGVLETSITGLLNGGPAGIIWGFLINWIGTISVYISLGELASMAPTSGGQYHWVAMMAPTRCSAFLSYVTGWMTTLAWQALAVSISYIIATLLQGIIVLSRPEYAPQAWHTLLIMWAVTFFAIVLNSTTSRMLARLESFILAVHLAGFFGVVIPLVYFAPHSSATEVFTMFTNTGGWSSDGLSFLVGFPTIVGALLGADCAVHMAEEIQSAAIVVPKALVYTILINGLLAFAMVIALMFCLGDLDAAVASTDTLFYPFLEIFRQAVASTTGACLLAGVILILCLASSIGVYASASRMLWSFARDLGLPFSRHLVKLNKTALPFVSIAATLGATTVLSLIVLGSAIALNALVSIVIAALFCSYTLVIGLALWRRVTGKIRPYSSRTDEDRKSGQLTWGPWKVHEPLGIANNIFSIVYSLFLLFWSFWPQTTPTTPEGFNWSIVVFFAVVLFSVFWYVFRAKAYFKGPIKEV
ncbi:amino acid transporter [Xylaria sp. CBS 124048]|nr:amino acid transporter [Xylaria sp. CBS 124048]